MEGDIPIERMRPEFDADANARNRDAADAAGDEDFFARLPEVTEFGRVVRREHYVDAPASWHLVISDVRGSTRAIEEGRYRDVNALGVASIIAVRNAVRDLELPYVFGGDGATLLVPGTRLAPVDRALRGTRELGRNAFELDLRIGRVPVSELAALGHAVRVERYRLSADIAQAMFSGVGFQVAERWVKDLELGTRYAIEDGEAEADFEGFECRWQPMKSQRGEVVCLLCVALARDEHEREDTYARVLTKLDQVLDKSDPIPISRRVMRMTGLLGDYSIEARVRSGAASGPSFEAARKFARKKTLIGRALVAFRREAGGFDGRSYESEVVANSDFRKFDETLRMVLDLTKAESAEVERWLASEHAAGRVAYGIHRSKAAVATCMVKTHQRDHVHFIDGSDGGYALAARALKTQLAARGS